MYAYFKGIVADLEEDAIILDVNDIGYRIFTTKDVLLSNRVGSTLILYTYTCVREDAFILYGFKSKDDLLLFKQLIMVSGVGPKMAQAILSGIDANSVRSAIVTQNSKLLSSAPGVGAKTANRIILELKDKVKLDDIVASLSEDDTTNAKVLELRQEAYEALTGLGISPLEATKALNEIEVTEDSKIEMIIKQLLAKI